LDELKEHVSYRGSFMGERRLSRTSRVRSVDFLFWSYRCPSKSRGGRQEWGLEGRKANRRLSRKSRSKTDPKLIETLFLPLCLQAAAAQKFRESQEMERRKHIEQMRYREQDKWQQVSVGGEAYKKLSSLHTLDLSLAGGRASSRHRDGRQGAQGGHAQARAGAGGEDPGEEAILARRQVRTMNEKFTFCTWNYWTFFLSREYAFGSCTPRTLHPTLGSTHDIWGASRR